MKQFMEIIILISLNNISLKNSSRNVRDIREYNDDIVETVITVMKLKIGDI